MSTNEIRPAEVFPPGEFIQEEMEARGWTQADLAQILEKPLPTINQIIKGKRAIIAETAHKLEAAFGISAEYWMNLETAWQLARADEPSGHDKVRRNAELYEMMPIREMQRRGWIKKAKSVEGLEQELRTFFNVGTLEDRPSLGMAARSSIRDNDGLPIASQWAWCRRANQVAQLVQAKSFRHANIEKLIFELKPLMADREEVRKVPKLLAEHGIRLVVVEHLAGTKIDGAAILDNPKKPVIALSMRYARLDYFWFTTLHELAHVFFKDQTQLDADICANRETTSEIEERANVQAANWIVDQEKMQSFIMRISPLYDSVKVKNFSRRAGVHPALIVGQLKHRGELDWGKLTRLQNEDVRELIKSVSIYDGWGFVAPTG